MMFVATKSDEPLTLLRPCYGGLFLLSLQRCVRLTVRRTYSGVAHHTSGGLVSQGSFTNLLFYADFALRLFDAEDDRGAKTPPARASCGQERRRFKVWYLSFYVFFLLIKLITMVKLDEELTPAVSGPVLKACGGGIHRVLATLDALAAEIAPVGRQCKMTCPSDGSVAGAAKCTTECGVARRKLLLTSARYTGLKERAKAGTKRAANEDPIDHRGDSGAGEGVSGSARLHRTVLALSSFLRCVLRHWTQTGRGASASRVSFPARILAGTPTGRDRNQWTLEKLNELMVKLGVRDRGCVLLLFKRVVNV
ncbi:hypothetical protein STCU_11048 [Strigomonas culicis]|uniref:Uncharacterized protein n=1 Tax=Strigomonas culicis TaxID=28005 RepID=S9TIK2_9TRYP|nr:hypothetical protein STCU_11048 [Strigomonas culicis]|eukprot:EPY16709.1 hypothetical protein STCU_11048 [Strigomonas culicis]